MKEWLTIKYCKFTVTYIVNSTFNLFFTKLLTIWKPKGAVIIANNYTITWNGRKTTFSLPDEPVRYWDNSIKIKFYHRGTRSYPTITKTGKFKAPRTETQLYINGKYFIQFSWTLNNENKEVITQMIQYLYIFGCDLPTIKDCLKRAFYQR